MGLCLNKQSEVNINNINTNLFQVSLDHVWRNSALDHQRGPQELVPVFRATVGDLKNLGAQRGYQWH